MKVLKRVSWKHTFDCYGCKSTLEADPSDVHFGEFHCMAESDFEFYIECPVCMTIHKLEYSDMPEDVRNMARTAGHSK